MVSPGLNPESGLETLLNMSPHFIQLTTEGVWALSSLDGIFLFE